MMSHDYTGNLRECAGRSVNEQTRIAKGTEETSAVTGRDRRKDRR